MTGRDRKTLRKHWQAWAMAGAATVILAACTSTPQTPPPCPQILIPADSAQLTRFKPGPGRDIIDVLHAEKVTGFAHRCTYDTDSTGAGELIVEVAPAIHASIGPASPDRIADFEYFLAITDQDKTILDKARFAMSIPFPQNQSQVQWQKPDPIKMRIPLKAGQNGDDFRVYLGLQLSPEELQYQRKTR